MAWRKQATKKCEQGDKKSQWRAHILTNTAAEAPFQASRRRYFYVRKIAEKRTRCRAAINISDVLRFTSR
jgi:hypothetical protein